MPSVMPSGVMPMSHGTVRGTALFPKARRKICFPIFRPRLPHDKKAAGATDMEYPRPHLPQVLFKEIELPSITLPAFHRKQKPAAAPAEEVVSEEVPDQAATDALENSLKSDLADLLSSGEETADEAVKPSKKKKKEEPAEIAEDLIEPTQETSGSGPRKEP